LKTVRSKLLLWFATSKRELPWRQTHDPYAIWISEIMLQQTQVATVLPYYFRFLERFPTVHELAAAQDAELMRYWEGLGYYRRARQLHSAAKEILEAHGGVFPIAYEKVLALPGIGRYTAGAICSFAYDAATPIVEANTQRLYARLLKWDKPLTERHSQEKLWEFATAILPETSGSREINYATMELGALVCKPQPDCPQCPLLKFCPTAREGLQASIPVPKIKTIYSDRYEAVFLIQDSASNEPVNAEQDDAPKYLIRQCGPNEWWTGLWDFPRIEINNDIFEELDKPLFHTLGLPMDSKRKKKSLPAQSNDSAFRSVEESLRERFGIEIQLASSSVRTIKHSVTRYRIQLRVCKAKMLAPLLGESTGFNWASLDELNSLPLSASARKVVQGLIN
jgi:A/G-specific adenine glycosylase